ncbi:23S rRNA (adenine(2503)-C(2))-methyltransferase RlmN [Marivirga arenosa]|jgi:23S rRNA (adenine2503-C2)-methyltransferase|uniref:Probable dual-specificity RNA methyltransferase RlmN n=1 Tax=Marivirga arenosa TaxID=3059076 RepID=A0AA51ZVW2_9BACT|nr:23S rRNA (adenine(2503)-C(2))-methyltransferase RlmN [Marivirga sp. BKB1-2]WNB17710.1 23S rRNA (adenine(2503)-C(2))-methyltransferase RlmN [Marivirga sp. BKB1-2]
MQEKAVHIEKEVIEVNLKKIDIRKMSIEAIAQDLTEFGEKAFRAKQIYEWLWVKSAASFEEMTNLSKGLREWLDENYCINRITIASKQLSNDRTIKVAFKLHDGHEVEGVLIPTENRMTACVSSQVGCSLSCKFCATGYLKRMRNLEAAEIYDQVVMIKELAETHYDMPLTNIVYMGMGEPLLNYKNMMESIEHITSEKGLFMSPKRITVSTAGISKMIKKLADDEAKFNLALSLHAANDEKRSRIMSINDSNNLPVLREALEYYYNKTKSRVTFEYCVFNNFNDSLEDAKELWQFTKYVPAKVNLIEYNPIDQADFTNTEEDKLDQFAKFLEDRGVIVNVRRSRGKDIDAACGQLANKH